MGGGREGGREGEREGGREGGRRKGGEEVSKGRYKHTLYTLSRMPPVPLCRNTTGLYPQFIPSSTINFTYVCSLVPEEKYTYLKLARSSVGVGRKN